MKNKIIKSFAIFVFAIAMTNCNVDDTIDQNQLSLKTLLTSGDNVENLSIGNYAFNASDGIYGGQLQMASDLIGSTNEFTWNGTFPEPRQYVDKAMNENNGFVDRLMSDSYDVINQSNSVLLGLPLFDDDETTDRRNRAEGGSKFLRALNFFDLVRLFGKQYEAGQVNNQPGVSLTLTSILEVLAENPRASVEEVYNQVIADLTDAINVLPSNESELADKASAEALLARVYLQQQNYSAALAAANNVINTSGHSLTGTFSEAFNNTSNSSEDIFAIQIESATNTQAFIFWSSLSPRPGSPEIAINQSFIDLYPAGDERGAFFTQDSNGMATNKYDNQAGNVPIIRLAEMYLIRAECNIRLNSSVGDSPLNDINRLRNRASAPQLTSVALDDVILERRLELAFEGHLLHDIKRLGLTAGGLNANDDKLVMPIPIAELNANPNSTQNSGY